MSFKFLGFVEEIFLHKTAKFNAETIMRSKVMKIYAKNLKNATEQACSSECIDAALSFHYKEWIWSVSNALVAHCSPYALGLWIQFS